MIIICITYAFDEMKHVQLIKLAYSNICSIALYIYVCFMTYWQNGKLKVQVKVIRMNLIDK